MLSLKTILIYLLGCWYLFDDVLMCLSKYRTTWTCQRDTSEPCRRETWPPLKVSRRASMPLKLSCSAWTWPSDQVSFHVFFKWCKFGKTQETNFREILSLWRGYNCRHFPSVGHEKLMAVTQQQLLFAELRDTFARRLTNHLNNVFVHQVTGPLLLALLFTYFICSFFNVKLHRSGCILLISCQMTKWVSKLLH